MTAYLDLEDLPVAAGASRPEPMDAVDIAQAAEVIVGARDRPFRILPADA